MAIIYNRDQNWLLGLSCDSQKNDSSLHIFRRGKKPIHENVYLICSFEWSTTMDLLPDMHHVVIGGSNKRTGGTKSFIEVLRVTEENIVSTLKYDLTKVLTKQDVTRIRVFDEHSRFLVGSSQMALVMQISKGCSKIKLLAKVPLSYPQVHDVWFTNFELIAVCLDDDQISRVVFEGWNAVPPKK